MAAGDDVVQALHEGNPRAAPEHFREALRLEPDDEYARSGIVHALRARHFLYRLMLAYFLWMSRLSGTVQLALIFGAVFRLATASVAGGTSPGD